MEGSNKSPWSRKRKLEAKMKRLREARRNKLRSSHYKRLSVHSIGSNASSSVAGPSDHEPVTESPEVPGLSVSTFIYGVIG